MPSLTTTLGAPLPRSIPDADSSVSYEFAMDKLIALDAAEVAQRQSS
jgi:hypothetical protein